MRTTKDRIRHLVLFEVTALLILVPIGAVFFGFDPFEIGALGASTAAIAAVWNYVYNLAYDHIFPIPEGKAKPADSRAGP